MTLSTSAVAVCCEGDSRSSDSSRAFSTAITACAAKFVDQLDLLVGERPHLLAIDAERADKRVFLDHGHNDGGACAANVGGRHAPRIFFLVGAARAQIVNVDGLLVDREAPHASIRCPDARLAAEFGKGWRHAARGSRRKGAVLELEHNAEFGIANVHGVFQHGVKHGSNSPGELEITLSTSEVAV